MYKTIKEIKSVFLILADNILTYNIKYIENTHFITSDYSGKISVYDAKNFSLIC